MAAVARAWHARARSAHYRGHDTRLARAGARGGGGFGEGLWTQLDARFRRAGPLAVRARASDAAASADSGFLLRRALVGLTRKTARTHRIGRAPLAAASLIDLAAASSDDEDSYHEGSSNHARPHSNVRARPLTVDPRRSCVQTCATPTRIGPTCHVGRCSAAKRRMANGDGHLLRNLHPRRRARRSPCDQGWRRKRVVSVPRSRRR